MNVYAVDGLLRRAQDGATPTQWQFVSEHEYLTARGPWRPYVHVWFSEVGPRTAAEMFEIAIGALDEVTRMRKE